MKPPKAVNKEASRLKFEEVLIAPCGMDCRLCMAYIRTKKACPSCRSDNPGKSKSCAGCKIKNCEELIRGNYQFCFSCESYPCERIKHIDKRYRTNYGMSMIENLSFIEERGIGEFTRREEEKWRCNECGEVLCVHYPICLSCRTAWR